jgi:hypothetical protein
MSLLAQLDVFQPKFFLNRSHRKARLPGDWERVPNKKPSRENILWSRFIRWNRILVVHRIFTSHPPNAHLIREPNWSIKLLANRFWLRLCRVALYRGFPIRRCGQAGTACRLEAGDTLGWKPALRSLGSSVALLGYELSGLALAQKQV